jgi:ABC-2 type transport system permease protein
MKIWQLTVSQIKMLARDRMQVIASLGIALISMILFGLLFGPSESVRFNLGIVDEDRSAASRQIREALANSQALAVKEGTRQEELNYLQRGELRAVLVMEKGFQEALRGGRATVKVYYDQSNATAAAIARAAVRSIVDGINRSLTNTVYPIVLEEEAVAAKHQRFIDFLTPGLLGMMIMWANMFVGAGLISWRERGILKRLEVTALRPAELISSQIAAHLLFSIIQAALFLSIAALLFQVPIEGNYLLLAGVIVMGILAMLAVGYVIGSFVRTSESASSVAMLLSFPMMFLSGSFFPVDGAPSFLQPIIKAMPLTYLNHALREIVNNGSGLGALHTDLLVLAGWMVGSLLISVKLFRWQ